MSAISAMYRTPNTYPNLNSLSTIFDFCSLDHIETATESVHGCVVGYFQGLTLTSHFQPIFSLAHKRPVGYEALLRAINGEGEYVAPQAVFNLPLNEQEAVYLDRLCRNLHLRNFLTLSDDTSWLFLNINPLVTIKGKQYGRYFAELLKRYHIPAHRIVVEILEESIQDETLLADAVDYYKELGCLGLVNE